jgi:hypothetical protein
MNYGLIERATDGTETVLSVSYDADAVPPAAGQTLLFARDGEESREMRVLAVEERPDVKPELLFAIVQPA